jgi:hypothetical protein
MPVSPIYPGVYVEEIPSGVRTIVGVATTLPRLWGEPSVVRWPTRRPSRALPILREPSAG